MMNVLRNWISFVPINVGLFIFFTAQTIPHANDNFEYQEAGLVIGSNTFCSRGHRPWNYLKRSIYTKLAKKELVEFSLDKISLIRISPATDSTVLKCIFEIQGTLKAQNISGETNAYYLYAKIIESGIDGHQIVKDFTIE